MQGKLVPQDPADEPSEILLETIKSEKEKLGAEKRFKRDKPLAPIKPEGLMFEIPLSWMWCRLSEISEIGTGATPLTSHTEYYDNGNIAWITSSATNYPFVNQTETFITEKALKETNYKVYPTGTLVVAMYGQGKTRGQVTELNIEAATNQACATISSYLKSFTLRKFIKLYFRKIYLEIRELAQGGAQPNLNMLKIKNTLIPLPPLAEQERIVAKLEKLMKFCDELETNIKQGIINADRLLQVALKEALEPKYDY